MGSTVRADRHRSELPDPARLPRPWLARYPPGVPPTYDYPSVPVTRFLDDAARDFPDVDATVHGRARLSYDRLRDAVDRFATALGELGVGRGTRVGVAVGDLPAAPVAVFAVLRLGGVVVQVDPSAPAARLVRQLRVTGCEVLVVIATALPRVRTIRGQLPRLRHVVATGVEDWLAFPADRLVRITGRRDGTYRRVTPGDDALLMRDLVKGTEPAARQTAVGPDTVAVVQFPAEGGGGGALLTHANLLAATFQARLWIPDIQAGRERILVAHPLASAHGLVVGLLASALAAATLVLPRRRDADAIVAAVEGEDVSLLHLGAALLGDVLGAIVGGRRDLDSLRAGLVGGGAVDPDALARLEEHTGARVRAAYGRPEAPFTHANPVYGRVERGHVGLPVTDTVAAVLDPADPARTLPPGVEGALAVHGPQVAVGVLTRQGPTPARGWLLTGDRAIMHEGGSFALMRGGAG